MNATTEFMDLLQVKYPILQAPMAGVATSAMAAAVSNAGGLGALGLCWVSFLRVYSTALQVAV